MNCETASKKIMEAARSRGPVDVAVQAHLNACPGCADWRQQQQALSANLRLMRIQSSGKRSSVEARAALLNQFTPQHHMSSAPRWFAAIAAAAVFLLAAFLVRDFTTRGLRSGGEPVAQAGAEADSQEEGFIDIPFAPPLAQGEMVRVVHTALLPAALAGMGVNVDPSWTTEFPADLLVGQDGFPRAVRVSNENSDGSGF